MVAQKSKPRKNIKVDKLTAIDLKKKGLTYQQIANLQGVSKQSIHKAIQYLIPSEHTEHYKNNRADIFAELQRKILASIDDDDIKKSPMGSRILAVAQIYDKERLERGGSTEAKPLIIVNRISIGNVERNSEQVIDVSATGSTIKRDDTV